MRQRRREDSAFATISALLLMAVVSGALLVLGALLRADANRTLGEADDAQSRQLIHAAAVDATAKLRAGADVSKGWDMPVPAGTNATVHITVDGQRATILVRRDVHHSSETISLEP